MTQSVWQINFRQLILKAKTNSLFCYFGNFSISSLPQVTWLKWNTCNSISLFFVVDTFGEAKFYSINVKVNLYFYINCCITIIPITSLKEMKRWKNIEEEKIPPFTCSFFRHFNQKVVLTFTLLHHIGQVMMETKVIKV